MIDYDYELLKTKTFEFIKILFPDFETCQKYYYDPNLDSDNAKTRLLAMLLKNPEEKIKNFNFANYINENNNKELYNYIKTFLPKKFNRTGVVIFNTLAQKILSFSCKNETKIKDDNTLFFSFLKEELDSFFSLVEKFTDKNDYLFYTHNIHIEKGLEKEKLLDNLFILSCDKSPVFVLKNIDYDIHQYWNFESLLIKSIVLIFGEKIKFYQELDSHTINLKNYGCNDLALYPINNWNSFANPYANQQSLWGPEIIINKENIAEVKTLLPQYMNIIKNLDKDDYKKISLDFYMDSLDKIGTAKITYNVIALESLFNVNRIDIKMNFIQRGVKLLQNFYDEIYWEAIEKDLEKAYKIRCDYTHGTSQRHKDATIELSKKISEYTRIILIVFLYLSPQVEALKGNTKEKKYINEKLIDKSLLYPIINENFSKMMKNISVNVKDFNSVVEITNL